MWDQKCESVNVTVPQRECDTMEEAVVEMKCTVLNETVSTPVCVTVIDKAVEEICEEEEPTEQCFAPSCTNITIPVLTKECRQTTEERWGNWYHAVSVFRCEVIIETQMEKQCTEVDQVTNNS